MESEDFQQYSQQNSGDSSLGNFPSSQYSFNSSEFRPQTSISQPHSFVHLDQFQNHYTPINLHYQRTFPANPMNASFSSQQQCGPGFSFQARLYVWRENMGGRDTTRDSNSLECRWSRIQPAVNKFHGFYEQLERNPRSGTTLEDTKMQAHRMYREMNNNKPFKHEECWEICRKNLKWCSQQLTKQGTSKKQKSAANDSSVGSPSSTQTTPVFSSIPIDIDADLSTPTAENTNPEEVKRPEGRKATKDKKKRMVAEKGVVDVLGNLQCTLEKQVEFNRKDYELREKILNEEIELKKRNEKRKEKDQKRKEQERILEKDLSKLDPDLRMALKSIPAKILKEWAEEDNVRDVPSIHDTGM